MAAGKQISIGVCLVVLGALVLQSCATDKLDASQITGTVIYLSFEGGFYGIRGDDGKNYDPSNLPEEFRQNGMRVQFESKQLTNQMSFHMWGVIVEIIHIHKL